MTKVQFGRLEDLAPRDAWAHEAHDFTPWLAENIDRIAEAVGVPLELTGQEMRVESFAADILARNLADDTTVLIENQLEKTDHTHLGQIMTYLAGLEAHTVIWIAPDFREPHLSAIRWLNEHTADGFAFFAVKLRVVRIENSPFAPILEVVEQPNDWDRQIARKRRETGGASSVLGESRSAFWNAYRDRHPQAGTEGVTGSRLSHAWFDVIPDKVHVVVWVGAPRSGIFVRGGYAAGPDQITELLEPHVEALAKQLEAEIGGKNGRFLHRRTDISLGDTARWYELIDWMEDTRQSYIRALRDALEGDA